MQANGHLARGLRLRDHFDYFIERHMRRVMNLSPVLAHIEKGRIDERSCIDDDIRLSKIACALYRDKLRITGPRTDNMNHTYTSLSLCRDNINRV